MSHVAVRTQQHQIVITQQQQQQPQQQNNIILFDKKIVLLIFILAVLLAGSIFRYEQFEQLRYQIEHQPKKRDILRSQSSKLLQDQEKYKKIDKNNKQSQSSSPLLLFNDIPQSKQIDNSGTNLLKNNINKDQTMIIMSQLNSSSYLNKHQINNQSEVNTLSFYSSLITEEQQQPTSQKQTTIYNFPIIFPIPLIQRKVTVVFTTCCDRYDLLADTLRSFFKVNTFTSQHGLEQIIVVNDGKTTLQLQNLKQKYLNIKWIDTQTKVGQIQAIDMAYSRIKTSFVFHAEDDWQFLRGGFIEISFDYFQRIPKLLQTWIKITNQTVNKETRVVQSEAFLFSFNPGLKRMEDYMLLGKGYKWISKNISHQKGAGKAQTLISRYYRKKGFIAAQSQLNYIRHTGQGRGLPRAG